MADIQTNKKSWEIKYTIEADKTLDTYKHADKETVEDLLKFGQEEKNREEWKQDALGTFYKDRYAKEKIPVNTIEKNIKKAVGFLRPKKYWGIMDDMQKRYDHAVKQTKRQRKLYNQENHLDQIFKEKRQYIEASVTEGQAKIIEEEYPDQYRDALRDWGVMEIELANGRKKTQDNMKYLASDRINFRESCMREILNNVKSFAKPENFAYKNDDDFIRDFAEKYDLLCKGASAAAFLTKMEQMVDNNEIEPVSLIEERAAIDFCQTLKHEYERRRELIASPYYALLTRDDIRRFINRNGDVDTDKVDQAVGNKMTEAEKDELVKFLNHYAALQDSKVGKNADLAQVYQEKLEAAQEDFAEKDARKIRDFELKRLGNYESDFKDRPQLVVSKAYAREVEKQERKYENYSKSEFLKEVSLAFAGGNMIGGMGPEHIEGFEKILAQILEKRTIGTGEETQRIKAGDLEELKTLAEEVSEMKREYLQMSGAVHAIENMLNCSVDFSNPKFKDQAEAKVAKKLKELYDAHIWDTKKTEAVNRCGYYVNHIQRVMETIVKKGYKILPDQGAYKDEKTAKKALKRELADYQNSRPLKEGQKKEEIQFPTVTVNGKQYCTYGYNGMAKVLEGQKIQFKKKDNAKKAGELFTKYEKLLKELAVMKGLYGSENGYKRFLLMCETNRINEQMKPVEDQIMKLCREEFPEKYMQTADDYFEKRKYEIYSAWNGACEESEQHYKYMVYERQNREGLDYKWNGDERQSKTLVSFVAYMERDQKEKTDYLQFYKHIRYTDDPKELTKKQKEEKIVATKKVLNAMLQFDIKSLSMKHPNELLGGRFFEQETFLLFCIETEPLVKSFKRLMEDPEGRKLMEKKDAATSFTEEQYQEVVARMDFFENASAILNTYRKVLKAPAAPKFNIPKLMEVDSEQLELMRVYIENRKSKVQGKAVSPLPYLNEADGQGEQMLDNPEIAFLALIANWKRTLEKHGGYHFADPMKTFQQYVKDNQQQQ